VPIKHFLWEACGRIGGGTPVLELAVDSRKTAQWKGARSASALAIEQTHPREWSSSPSARRTTAATCETRYGVAYI
jgi:hypothetical protein